MPAAWFDDDDDEDFSSGRESRDPGYDVLAGTAVIQVAGTLVQKRCLASPLLGDDRL